MTIPVDVVEVAARAAYELLKKETAAWENLAESEKDEFRDEARTVLMSVHASWPNPYRSQA